MSTLEHDFEALRENPWDTITLRYDAGEWRCTLQEDFMRDVEGPLCLTAAAAVRGAITAALLGVPPFKMPRNRGRGYAGGLLVKFYEPGPARGTAVVWRHGAVQEILLRRPRLIWTGFLPRNSRFRPFYDIVRLPRRGASTVVAVGCEGRALAVHLGPAS